MVLLEHLLVAIKVMIMVLIDDVPEGVQLKMIQVGSDSPLLALNLTQRLYAIQSAARAAR